MIRISSGCKINLGLRITGKLANGYHTLQSIFYPLRFPRDEILIERSSQEDLQILSLPAWLDILNNTLRKTYDSFCQVYGKKPGLLVRLVKRVPAGAGLGGANGNAAAFLQWLNTAFGTFLNDGQLLELADRAGADTPFFLRNIPCAVTGRGDILRPIRFGGHGLHLLVIAPPIHINTAQVFKAWDQLHDPAHSLTDLVKQANDFGSLWDPRINLDVGNDLEEPVYNIWPQLSRLKDRLLDMGAIKAAMSGSGSAHYGIFTDSGLAEKAANFFRKKGMRAYLAPMRDFGA